LARDDIDVNSKDECSRSPLSFAAENGHLEVTKLLLARDDIDVNSKDNRGQSPLAYAGHSEIVQLFKARTTTGLSSLNDVVASRATMFSSYPRSDGMQYSFDAPRTCII
jgi:ankyrin repeat protein